MQMSGSVEINGGIPFVADAPLSGAHTRLWWAEANPAYVSSAQTSIWMMKSQYFRQALAC